VASPLIGLVAGYGLMVAFYWIFRGFSPGKSIPSSAGYSLRARRLLASHGANDAQKTMGIIVGL
jgi:PiT family inorganic phosphate transporter